jgi:hypothetical protein
MEFEQLNQLILRSVEHERGGVRVYETAIRCAVRNDLLEEWGRRLEETRLHVKILGRVCEVLQLDPDEPSLGRKAVRNLTAALVSAMEETLAGADANSAELVASECVALTETRDRVDREKIGRSARKLSHAAGTALLQAYADVDGAGDTLHSKGGCRELWMEALGMRPVFATPESGASEAMS